MQLIPRPPFSFNRALMLAFALGLGGGSAAQAADHPASRTIAAVLDDRRGGYAFDSRRNLSRAGYAAAGGLLVIAGLFGWNRVLKKRVRHRTSALRESDLQFRQLAENIREVFWLTDPGKHVLLYVSPAYEDIWGRTRASLLASPEQWPDAIHPDDRERMRAVVSARQATGCYDEEFRIVRPDKTVRWIRERAFPVRNGGGAVYRIAGLAEDITARKQGESASIQLAEIVASSADAIIGQDLRGTITSWNHGAEKIFGYSADEILGTSSTRLIPAGRLEEEIQIMAKIARGENIDHFETLRQARDGRLIDLSVSISPIKDAAGRVVGVSKVARDFTERKRSDNRRRESERRFREMLENVELIAMTLDCEGRVTFCNDYLLQLTGWRRDEVMGQDWFARFIPRESTARQVFVDTVHSGSVPAHFEIPIRTKTDVSRDILWNNTMLRDSAGKIIGTASIGQDITDRKWAEADLRFSDQQLRALVARLHTVREEEAKRIARELHDDLGQQLTALDMELNDLESKLPAATPEQRRQITRMHAVADHMIDAVQKIAGELRLGQLDVFGLTAAIEWQLTEFSRRSAIPCRIIRLDEVTGLSDAHNTAIFRILQEALTNIVRHAVATEVHVSLVAADDQITLTVHDNGRGITAAELKDHQALGLVGIRERARLAGGTVTITGAAGRGTTVLVVIPRLKATPLAA